MPKLLGPLMHGGLPLGLAAPGGARRLGIDRDDLVPASTSASRLGTAKSGDPMKTMRMGRAYGRARRRNLPYLGSHGIQEIEALSQALARLPGLGPRSARRAVLHLMKKRETALQPLLAALQSVADAVDLLDLRQCRYVRPVLDLPRPAPRRELAVRGRGGRGPVGARPLAALSPAAIMCSGAACRRSKASGPRT